jgi:arylsulfatase
MMLGCPKSAQDSTPTTPPPVDTNEDSQDDSAAPNILLLVGDDIGFGDLGFSGAATRTPNLDKLAQQGAFFTNFHVSPVCSVTRSMLLTGNDPIEVGLAAFDYTLYPPANGKPGYESYLTRNTVTVAELLQDAGYRTYMAGKWHLGGAHGGDGPEKWGFDRSYGIYTGGANHWNQGVFHVDTHDPEVMEQLKRGEIPQEPYHENGQPVVRPDGVYSDDLWTSKLLGYLEEGRETGKPFFVYAAYTTAHAPIQAPADLIDKYFDHYLELGFEGLQRARYEAQKKLGIIPQDAPFPERKENSLLRAWSELDEEEKRLQARYMATYSAMMESQDQHIGRILDYLKETVELYNTLIIYTSDNGPEGFSLQGTLSNAAHNKWVAANFSQEFDDIGKGNSYRFIESDWAGAANGSLKWWKWFLNEGGIRVPLLVVPPKNPAFAQSGAKNNEYAYVKELPMTILDYAGVEHPRTKFKDRTLTPPSGISLRPFLEGKESRLRTDEQWVAFELFGNTYIVVGDYKAIRVRTGMFGDGKWHLYDIKKDPGETRPLEGEQPERLQKMVSLYESYAVEKGIVPVEEDWNPWSGL